MATTPLHSFDRRTLIARSAAAAAFATLAQRHAFASQASPSPEAGREQIQQLVTGNTAFALDLYRAFRQGVDGNIVFSPFSVSLAMAMVYAGARGETASQMAEVLGFSSADIHKAFRTLTADLTERGTVNDEGRNAETSIANALWGEKTFPFSGKFAMRLHEDFGLWLELTDFSTDPEASRHEINDWVATKTADHIQDIVPEGAITAATRLVLANAIYFASNWRDTFDEDDTADETFHLADGTTIDTPFMVQTEGFRYAKSAGAQVVELPYVADGFAMTIILPDDGQLDAFEERFDAETLADLVGALDFTQVELHLPKFTFNLGQSLSEMLASLGMADLFDPNRADLGGMVDSDSDEKLAVSAVLHEAFIDIDENGTEAAAATVVLMPTSAAPQQEQEKPVVLEVDRPFLFAIRDTETGTLLFLGRVMKPGGE